MAAIAKADTLASPGFFDRLWDNRNFLSLLFMMPAGVLLLHCEWPRVTGEATNKREELSRASATSCPSPRTHAGRPLPSCESV